MQCPIFINFCVRYLWILEHTINKNLIIAMCFKSARKQIPACRYLYIEIYKIYFSLRFFFKLPLSKRDATIARPLNVCACYLVMLACERNSKRVGDFVQAYYSSVLHICFVLHLFGLRCCFTGWIQQGQVQQVIARSSLNQLDGYFINRIRFILAPIGSSGAIHVIIN